MHESKESSSETKEELELSNFLNEFHDVFTDESLGSYLPKEGQMIILYTLYQVAHHLIGLPIESLWLNKRKS